MALTETTAARSLMVGNAMCLVAKKGGHDEFYLTYNSVMGTRHLCLSIFNWWPQACWQCDAQALLEGEVQMIGM